MIKYFIETPNIFRRLLGLRHYRRLRTLSDYFLLYLRLRDRGRHTFRSYLQNPHRQGDMVLECKFHRNVLGKEEVEEG